MGDAIWLLVVLPVWFVEASLAFISNPGGAGLFAIVSALGVVALALGVAVGAAVSHHRARMVWFLASPLASEVFVTVAGLLQGKVQEPLATSVAGLFLIAQLCLCLLLIVWAKGMRISAMALSVFSLCYALFAAYVASMAFRNDWG